MPIPLLSDIPILGPMLFNQAPLTYIALLAVPATAWLLYRTPWGLDLRTVGENPRAADAAGVSVWGMRTQALVIGGALMGMAGRFLSISQFNAFTFGVVSGRGWVAVALVVFGLWSPWRCAAGALLFAALEALAAPPAGEQCAAPALPGLSDAALRHDHRRDGARLAQRPRAGGAARAVPQGGAVMVASSDQPCCVLRGSASRSTSA